MAPNDPPPPGILNIDVRSGCPLRIGAVILAGGRGRRLGRDKASLLIGAETALGRVCGTVAPVVERMVVAARQGQALPQLHSRIAVARDSVADCGPLAGMLAGFEALRDLGMGAALVVACDHPLVARDLLEALARRLTTGRAVAVRHEGRVFPLLAGYRLDALSPLSAAVEARRLRVQAFLQSCKPSFLEGAELLAADADLRSLINVNDESQLEEANRALLRDPRASD